MKAIYSFFGNPSRPLFGGYYPAGKGTSQRGAVICNSIGQEGIRAHNATCSLAHALVGEGIPAMKFDYSGCGDAYGEFENGNMRQWISDISNAIAHLQSQSGLREVILIGMSLGANLAADLARKHHDVSAVVLWEPVRNGQTYLEKLRKIQESKFSAIQLSASLRDPNEYLGFRHSDQLLNEIRTLNIQMDVFQIPALYIHEDTNDRFPEGGANLTQLCIDEPNSLWNYSAGLGKGLVPMRTILQIIQWIGDAENR